MKLRSRDMRALSCEVYYAMLDAQMRWISGETSDRESIVETFNATVRAITRRGLSTVLLHAALDACDDIRHKRRKRRARYRRGVESQRPRRRSP